jgi:dTDP-4-dehydrorhamnose reductase
MNSVLVLGASGMLGSTVLSWLRGCPHMDLGGTTRRRALVPVIPGDVRSFALEAGLDLSPQLTEIFDDFPADYVINCQTS